MTTIRVRALLGQLNSVERQELKKLLPRGIHVPEEPDGVRYPSALLGILPKGEQYSLTGHITEALLRHPPIAITLDLLCATAIQWCPDLTEVALDKIRKSKTTEPYLAHIRETRKKLRFVARGDLQYDQAVQGTRVEGHPDIRTATQIFEVKMTGQLKQNWVDFLFQVFAYAALAPETMDLYLVLPLQEIIWHYDVRTWNRRADYAAYLEAAAVKKDTLAGTGFLAMTLLAEHHIGSHMPKLPRLADTVHSLPLDRPSQIFLAGAQTSYMNLKEDDVAAAAALINQTGRRLYIHSQYLINLCQPAGTQDDYHTKLLIRNLEAGKALGARGVVVHVGKSVKADPVQAVAAMRANTRACLEYASPECPLLLETPAGQGSEVLRTWEEFAAFVTEIADPRLRICIDTCHVFACGHDPATYLKRFLATHPGLTRLIHFNDSAAPCGSCVDRHAFCGQGHIGLTKMTEIAEAATAADLPMVVE